jgi:hypothetical protein
MTKAFKVGISAPSIIKDGGTSLQYLMADGSVTTSTGGGTTTNALTLGTGLTGSSFNGSAAITATVDSSVIAYLANANNFTTTQTITPGTAVTALAINGATSSTGVLIKAAATPGTFIDYRDNSNVSVGSVGSDGTHFIKNIRNVGGSANRAVFSDLTASIIVNAANTNYIGLSVRRFNDSQTYDLQQWTNSSASTVYAKIDKDGNLTAASIVKTSGTSSQFLKADGTVDSSTYLTTGTASSTYLPLTGGTLLDIIPLDDISNEINGQTSRFLPKYQGQQITINNPLRLLVTINGIIQTVGFTDNTWQSFLPKDGFVVDYDGYIAFSEVVPIGSSFHGRLMAGSDTTSRSTTYPFRASDILLGE